MVKLDNEINVTQVRITILKQKASECRLQFHIAKLDAIDALDDGDVITFHEKMVEYYRLKNNYNKFMSNLYSERKFLNELIDDYYMWFGGRRKKSKHAKQDRRKKSLRWRQENTVDKWRTPNKIKTRVSKLPKEDNNE